jgi:hypothetical protein
MKSGKIPQRIVWAAALLFLLCGCPYESQVPLGRSSEAGIDTELLGMWQSRGGDPKEVGTVAITRFNEHELLIVIHEKGTKGDDYYRAFTSLVDGEKFLSVQEIRLSKGERKWNLVNYSVSGDVLNVRIVEDALFKKKKTTPEPLDAFIKANLKNKKLYDDDLPVLTRVKPKAG